MKQNLSKKEAQELVWKFINEFRDRVVVNFSNLIDFIIIYGSSVRGEFVPGKSDVDIVIQILKKEDKEMVEKIATEIFWEVVKKYPSLDFEKSLSTSHEKKRNALTAVLEKIEKKSFLFVPIFVFSKGEIDWKKGEFHSNNPLIKAGQKVLVPQRTVFLRFKQEGKILYGRDIREEIDIQLTIFDRLRLGILPLLLSFIGFVLSPFIPDKSRSYTVKALLYQIDALLTALSDYEQMQRDEKINKAQKMLLSEFTERLQKLLFLKLDHTRGILRPMDFNLFQVAVEIKWGSKKLNYFQNLWFAFKAFFFILRSNSRALALIMIRNK